MTDKDKDKIVGFILIVLWWFLLNIHLHLINTSISKLERQMQSYDTVTSQTLPITWELIKEARNNNGYIK